MSKQRFRLYKFFTNGIRRVVDDDTIREGGVIVTATQQVLSNLASWKCGKVDRVGQVLVHHKYFPEKHAYLSMRS
jgi:hypothetical protein